MRGGADRERDGKRLDSGGKEIRRGGQLARESSLNIQPLRRFRQGGWRSPKAARLKWKHETLKLRAIGHFGRILAKMLKMILANRRSRRSSRAASERDSWIFASECLTSSRQISLCAAYDHSAGETNSE